MQHAGGDGLPKWTAANRSLEGADPVLWYRCACRCCCPCPPSLPAAVLLMFLALLALNCCLITAAHSPAASTLQLRHHARAPARGLPGDAGRSVR